MTISPQSQYHDIQSALEAGRPLAFDKQENRFTILSTEVSSSDLETRYITDLGTLKDKVVEFIKQNGIAESQLKELTQAFETAAKKLESAPSAESQKQVSQLKEFPAAIAKAAEQAAKIPSQIPATPGRGVKEPSVPSQQQISEALAVKIQMEAKLPESLKQMVECFETEGKFYLQNTHLNALFHDPDFINILKDQTIGDASLNVLDIATLGNFQPILRESEKMTLGLFNIYQMIQQGHYKEAMQAYVQLMTHSYGDYANALAERTQAYLTFSAHAKKLKAAEDEFRKKYQAKYKKIFPDRLSIADKAITSVQRGPRHDMFADVISRKSGELRVERLSDISTMIKFANRKINQQQDEFERTKMKGELEDALVYVVAKKGDKLERKIWEDQAWQESLAHVGLDQAALLHISGWYDAFGKTIAQLKLPIRALEEDPNNIELQKAVQPPLIQLKNDLAAAGIQLDRLPAQDLGLENLSNAIRDYNSTQAPAKTLSDFGTLMSERLALVSGWIRRYT